MGTQAKCHNSSLFEHQWLWGNAARRQSMDWAMRLRQVRDGKGNSAGNLVFGNMFGIVSPQVNVASIKICERRVEEFPNWIKSNPDDRNCSKSI